VHIGSSTKIRAHDPEMSFFAHLCGSQMEAVL
jgi:hypothetical protein